LSILGWLNHNGPCTAEQYKRWYRVVYRSSKMPFPGIDGDGPWNTAGRLCFDGAVVAQCLWISDSLVVIKQWVALELSWKCLNPVGCGAMGRLLWHSRQASHPKIL
jgi:hypothetical protein